MGQNLGYAFPPLKKFKATSQSAWRKKHLPAIGWSNSELL